MSDKKYLLRHTALSTPFMFMGLHAAIAADIVTPQVGPTTPESLPAVSGINGKLEILGGGTNRGIDAFVPFTPFPVDDDFEGAFLAKGALTFPVGHRFGLQADGIVGSVQDETFWQGGGHLFWRDPSIGLLGGYAAYSTWDDVSATHVGVEGEVYFGQFTLRGVVGGEWGDIDDGLFTIADASFYAIDDFAVTIGHRYGDEIGHAFTAGLEYQFYQTNGVAVSLYADGRLGEDDYQSIFGGIKLYFGEDKSLIRRHREDDPTIWIFLQSLLACTQKASPTLVDAIGDAALPPQGAVAADAVFDLAVNQDVECGADYMSTFF